MDVPWHLIGGAGFALAAILFFYFVIVRHGR